MNKDMLVKLFIFTAGAAIGSAVTWNFVKTKYEQMADEEIESVKQHYKEKEQQIILGKNMADGAVEGYEGIKKDIKENMDVASMHPDEDTREMYETYAKRYSSEQNERPQKIKEEEEENVEKPYVISPEEFGEIEEYETISLTLYDDGVLTDDDGNIIDDVEGTVGKESLNHFGEYEEDSVFVRNDERRCDYEILADAMTYEEAFAE